MRCLNLHLPQCIQHRPAVPICVASTAVEVKKKVDETQKYNLTWTHVRDMFELKTRHYLELDKTKAPTYADTALAAILETKRKFVRRMNHEIRTPMHVISTVLEMLGRKFLSVLSPEGAELVEEANTACSIVVDFLDDLLAYEHLEGGSLVLNKTFADLQQLLRRSLGFFLIEAKSSNIQIEVVNQLPAETVLVDADKGKLSQVFRNLLANAMKFTPMGGSITVILRALTPELVRVEVQDTGPALSVEARQKMFREPVQMQSEALQSEQGEGMGLSLCRRIVELHGGALGIDLDWSGVGSHYFVDLPIADPIRAETSAAASLETSLSEIELEKAVAPRFRLLLVDDAAICRRFHRHALQPACSELLEATNGQEAVSIMRTALASGQLIDGILMDSSMPLMNGTTATRMIRDMGYTGPVFGVTGNAFQADIEDFLQHGADEVLIKPINMDKYSYILDAIGAARKLSSRSS